MSEPLKLKQWVNNIKLQNKLVIIYVVTGLLPLIILFVFAYGQMRSILMDRDVRSMESALRQSVTTVDGQIEVYDNLSNYITFNETVSGILSYNYSNKYEMYSQIVTTFDPLVFMISMAFTSYSKVDSHLVLFDWVGLENFKLIFNSGSSIGQSFWSVFGWTIIWAVLATFLNYILGILVALLINRKGTKFKSFWRFIFILSIAIPQFVSLLIIRSMLAQDGIINVVLKNAGWISKSLPFFTNATWARMTVIIVNLWIGIPYTILQVTGILQNIPMELYEAADVDGANGFVKFFKITMPYMLFVTTPYLITTFTANVNNFNIVYLLTKGDPVLAGHTAGKTDLLVTWLYKMTVDYQYYNLGAVIGIMTFVFLALGSLLVYRRTKSYKDEEGFQ